MSRYSKAAIAIAAALAATACGQSSPTPTPRRHAYPRTEIYDTVYAPAPEAPLSFCVNAAAKAMPDSAGRWLTVEYPLYKATLYVTFSEADSPEGLEATLANRRERISLNLAGASATTTHIASPAGFESVLVEAPGETLPLQFVSTDGSRWAVSGAVQMQHPAPYDSVRPTTDAMRRDLVRALASLAPAGPETQAQKPTHR